MLLKQQDVRMKSGKCKILPKWVSAEIALATSFFANCGGQDYESLLCHQSSVYAMLVSRMHGLRIKVYVGVE